MNSSETLSAIKTVFTERTKGFLQRKHEQNRRRLLEPSLNICFLFEQITTNHVSIYFGGSEREIGASDSVTKGFGFVQTCVVIRLKRQKVRSCNGENKI